MSPAALIFTGPESTGKTTLAEKIRLFFDVPIAQEFARPYLSGKPMGKYTLPDLKIIAEGQLEAQTSAQRIAAENKKNFYICDTDLITLKIWSEEIFGACDDFILKNLDFGLYTLDVGRWKQKFISPTFNVQSSISNVYFLCSPKNISWQPDPLRENPNDRERLFELYEKTLIAYKKKYLILEGTQTERFFTVKKFIQQHLL